MLKQNIYVGELKKCIDYDKFRKIGEYEFNEIETKTGLPIQLRNNNYTVVSKCAIFIKVAEDKYIWLRDINSLSKEILTNLGLNLDTIGVFPTSNNMLYVDPDQLVPYYTKKEAKQKIYVNRLKRETMLDSRIPSGIEH